MRAFLAKLMFAVLTAIVTLGFAYGLSSLSHQSDLAARVDRNAQVTRAGVASIVCILNIQPDDRTDSNLRACLVTNGYVGQVDLGG